MMMAAVMMLTVLHPGFCLGGMWATIGVPTGKECDDVAVHSSSRISGIQAMMDRFAGKGGKVNNAVEPEKATANSSA